MFHRRSIVLALLALVATAGLGWTYMARTTRVANTTCCAPGAACCEAGLPCCETGSCCYEGSPCCVPGADCCEGGDCCVVGAPCCSGGSPCCGEKVSTTTKSTAAAKGSCYSSSR